MKVRFYVDTHPGCDLKSMVCAWSQPPNLDCNSKRYSFIVDIPEHALDTAELVALDSEE